MSNIVFGDRLIDGGLSVLDTEATHLTICHTRPTSYAQAFPGSPDVSFAIGQKTISGGFGAPYSSASPDVLGRFIDLAGFSGGSVTQNGVANYFAIVDNVNSRLLVTAPVTVTGSPAGGDVVAGQTFSVATITIYMPPGTAAAGAYAGPGDILPAATAWWGLRAYTLALLGNACAIVFATDDTSFTTPITLFTSLTTGIVDVSGLNPAKTYHISQLHDQTGNGYHLQQPNAQDATRPTLIRVTTSLNNLPTAQGDGGKQLVTDHNGPTFFNPFCASAVVIRTGDFTGEQRCISTPGLGIILGFDNIVDTVYCYENGGLHGRAAAADNVWHTLFAMYNGTSSKIKVDSGSLVAVDLGAVSETGPDLFIAMHAMTGNWVEGGLWSSDVSASFGALNTQQRAVWGITT